MKARRNESSKKPRCGGAVAAWLLVPLLVLVLLKTDCLLQVTPRKSSELNNYLRSTVCCTFWFQVCSYL
jgi:hypothetical protein